MRWNGIRNGNWSGMWTIGQKVLEINLCAKKNQIEGPQHHFVVQGLKKGKLCHFLTLTLINPNPNCDNISQPIHSERCMIFLGQPAVKGSAYIPAHAHEIFLSWPTVKGSAYIPAHTL